MKPSTSIFAAIISLILAASTSADAVTLGTFGITKKKVVPTTVVTTKVVENKTTLTPTPVAVPGTVVKTSDTPVPEEKLGIATSSSSPSPTLGGTRVGVSSAIGVSTSLADIVLNEAVSIAPLEVKAPQLEDIVPESILAARQLLVPYDAPTICPVSTEGHCVYQMKTLAYRSVRDRDLEIIMRQLMKDPEILARAAAERDPINRGKQCDLKAICIFTSYEKDSKYVVEDKFTISGQGTVEIGRWVVEMLPGATWLIDDPVVIGVHAKTAASDIPVYLDFRGPTDQMTTITTTNGTFATPASPPPCGVTFDINHLFVAGFKVENMPGDGICDKAGVVDLNMSDMASNDNGGNGFNLASDDGSCTDCTAIGNDKNGFLVTGDRWHLTRVTANSNLETGIRLEGDGTTVADSTVNSNGTNGIESNGDGIIITGTTADNNGTNGIQINGDDTTVTASHTNGNGASGEGNGIEINGDRAQIIDSEASYNTDDGVAANGKDTVIEGLTAIDNGEHGLHVAAEATGASIVDSNLAGNAEGNILDESGTLRAQNIDLSCPSGYTTSSKGICILICAENQFNLIGECADSCPEHFVADSDRICRHTSAIGDGETDTDHDGIADIDDACPDTPELYASEDAALDGVIDGCPNVSMNALHNKSAFFTPDKARMLSSGGGCSFLPGAEAASNPLLLTMMAAALATILFRREKP